MEDKKKDKDADEPKKVDKEVIQLNTTLQGQLAYQSAEHAYDKANLDSAISLRSEIDIKTQMVLKRFKKELIEKYKKDNGGEVTPEIIKKVLEDLKEHPLIKRMEEGTTQGNTTIKNIHGMKDFMKMSPQDVMELLAYMDIPKLRIDNNIVTAMVDDEDLPVVPELTTDDLIEKKITKVLDARLFGEDKEHGK